MYNLFKMSKLLVLFVAILILFGLLFYKSRGTEVSSPKSYRQTSENLEKSSRTEVVVDNLEVPWAMAFLPDGRLLITERIGRIKILDKNGQISQIARISDIAQISESGLHGITVHPEFSVNQYVYIYYTYSSESGKNLNRVARYKFQNNNLSDRKIILDEIPAAAIHDGGRIKFGPDGFLYITTGDAANPSFSQDKNSLAGKILRLTDEGKNAPDNPFGNAVYSYGHRNPQGLAWDESGTLWETEHGSTATDELNRVQIGGNFGWPDVRGEQTRDDVVSPVLQSGSETWAPAGMAYLNGSLFFGGLRGQALFEVKISNQNFNLTKHFEGELGRIRDVVASTDGFLYISTSNRDGRGVARLGDDKIIKINPGKL